MSDYSLEDAACRGAETRTIYNAMGDMEECVVCQRRVRWDLTEHPFFGFATNCENASTSGTSERDKG